MPTTNTPMRLTDADRAKIEELRERMGLPSLAAAVRFAVNDAHRRHCEPARPPRKPKG